MKIRGQTSLDVEISMLYFLMVHKAAEESLLRFERPRTIKKYVDDGGRFIVLNTLTEDSPVVLINYYAPDEEKDQLKVLNWRPISLINVDTKIASKALAARMKIVLTSIVHCIQTAYVKDRYIGESVRLITDLLAYTEENSIGGILFSADFEKAFDSIEHSFIFSTLKSFGFGAQFIQWIQTIFNSTESCVINVIQLAFSYWKRERVKVTLFQHSFSSCVSRHCSYKFLTMKV